MNLSVRTLFIIPFFVFTTAQSQDISGVWTGNYSKSSLMAHPLKLVVELSISNDSIISGMSHLYYPHNEYEHYRIRGIYRRSKGLVYFKEDSVIAVDVGKNTNCLGNYTMDLQITDTSMRLTGIWKDNSRALFQCPNIKVSFEKPYQKIIVHQREEPQLPEETQPEIVQPKAEDTVLKRELEVQKLIELDPDEKDSILVTLYDNGEIDGDSVSVYLDKKMIVSKVRINDQPISFYISLDPLIPIHKILMVAESIGSIPPCTALMIVKTKKHRYEMNLSSTFSKNAVMEFFFRE